MSDQYFQQQAAQPMQGGQLQYAGWWSRVGARFIDGLILFIPNAIISGVLVKPILGGTFDGAGGGMALFGAIFLAQVASVFTQLAYEGYFLGNKGQTPGKMALSIRVVDENTGELIGVPRACGRVGWTFLLGIIPFVGLLDILAPLWDSRNQAWHDKLAKTVVVRAS